MLVRVFKILCLLSGGLWLQAITAEAQPVTKAAGGFRHSLFLKADGSLWAMGNNQFGQLGDGTYNPTNRPELIVASNVVTIAAGGFYSLFVKSDGSLWGMGLNTESQLGDPSYSQTNQPQEIVSSNVVDVSAGSDFTIFLKSDGSLWSMGGNVFGQLGDGSDNQADVPQPIVSSNVVAVATGNWHALYLMNDGSLWGMGLNEFGELGNGNSATEQVAIPEEIVSNNVTAISAGFDFSLFLEADGTLWGMGDNQSGQLGLGTLTTTDVPVQLISGDITAIAGGNLHSIFRKSDGSLWTMGSNVFGQLGDGTFNQTNFAEQVVAGGISALARQNESDFTLFIKDDGSLWAMGQNVYGQLGDGTTNNITLPKQIIAPYNQIFIQPLTNGDLQFSFEGMASAKYSLERAFNLSPPDWSPQTTNCANSFGALLFTNTPDLTTNNFWRIRSIP